MTAIKNTNTKTRQWPYYYGLRRRNYRFRYYRGFKKAFRSGAYQYQRYSIVRYLQVKSISTGTNKTSFEFYSIPEAQEGWPLQTVLFDNIIRADVNWNHWGSYYSQYRITGVRLDCFPGNNNFHRNQAEDPIVLVGIQNTNKSNQTTQPSFETVVNDKAFIHCNSFETVHKYIPVRMDWLNYSTPSNVRLTCTQSDFASISYAPNFYIRATLYITFRGNEYGKKLMIDMDQAVGQ